MLLSYTTVSNQILNELLTDKVGTGEILLLKDKFNQKEITDFEIIVGKSFVEGNYIDTTFEKYIILEQEHLWFNMLTRRLNNENSKGLWS